MTPGYVSEIGYSSEVPLIIGEEGVNMSEKYECKDGLHIYYEVSTLPSMLTVVTSFHKFHHQSNAIVVRYFFFTSVK
jgi:hypothetical protein